MHDPTCYFKGVVVLLLVFLATSSFATPNDTGTTAQKRPNIVIFMSDDQDLMLGSMDVMHNTHRRIIQRGATFSNAFTTSPICCPSRSSFLTGLYSHNHHVLTNNDNCSSSLWQRKFETRTFATYLNQTGYTTGYFGKYLNEYNGSHVPAGWQYWMGLLRNTRYYNYTLRHNDRKEKHGDNYAEDYFTDLVVNRSVEHFVSNKEKDPDKPILTMLSFPAPHGTEDGAPQYQHLYNNVSSHVTPSYNHIPNPDKHWILQQITEHMDETQHRFSQMLQQKRLQTLRSVDDAVEKFVSMLERLGELDNTYIIYTSDHGFHIGQFGLAKGKSMPYDFDIRVPFYMRGPGIPENSELRDIVLNIDVAPTILGLAGVDVPEWMDGRNFMPLISGRNNLNTPWRDSFLVERGKIKLKNAIRLARKDLKNTVSSLVNQTCSGVEYQFPCQPRQVWTCVMDEEKNSLRIRKCNKFRTKQPRPRRPKKRCRCPDGDNAMKRPKVMKLSKRCKSRLFKLKASLDTRGFQGRRRPNKQRKNRDFTGGIGDVTREGGLAASRDLELLDVDNVRVPTDRSRRNSDFDIERATNAARNLNYSAPFLNNIVMISPHCNLNTVTGSIICNKAPANDGKWKKRRNEFIARSIRHMKVGVRYMKILKQCMAKSKARFEISKAAPKKCKCPSSTKPPASSTSAAVGNPMRSIQQERAERVAEFREIMRDRQQVRYAKIIKKQKKKKNSTETTRCSHSGMNCFRLNKNKWVTPPRWEGEDECYCANSNNNTYWCIRIINATTNVLYCEYITGFIEYFDLNRDPHQLENTYLELSEHHLVALNKELVQLRHCKGAANCHVHRPQIAALPPPSDNLEIDFLLDTSNSSTTNGITTTSSTTGSTPAPFLPTNYPPGIDYRRLTAPRRRTSKKLRRRNKQAAELLDTKRRSRAGRFRRSCKLPYLSWSPKCIRKKGQLKI